MFDHRAVLTKDVLLCSLDVRDLEDAMTRSFHKGTTRKLASELQSTISGSCIRPKLTA